MSGLFELGAGRAERKMCSSPSFFTLSLILVMYRDTLGGLDMACSGDERSGTR